MRMTPDMLDRLGKRATHNDLSMASYVRLLLLKALDGPDRVIQP